MDLHNLVFKGCLRRDELGEGFRVAEAHYFALVDESVLVNASEDGLRKKSAAVALMIEDRVSIRLSVEPLHFLLRLLVKLLSCFHILEDLFPLLVEQVLPRVGWYSHDVASPGLLQTSEDYVLVYFTVFGGSLARVRVIVSLEMQHRILEFHQVMLMELVGFLNELLHVFRGDLVHYSQQIFELVELFFTQGFEVFPWAKDVLAAVGQAEEDSVPLEPLDLFDSKQLKLVEG
mmetsp:Transcript_21437/g.33120  ORF Transcript_21437/g.33120 Transcript_21437/m.33120 type:complete len:232 (-) Transcript_21437:1622-2317(-)|eukprot:CAMPEP_0170510088 /NCGR_PEP_ID=MMETSP0208-20121228/65571_1 /TAXON_ID=197538 /ORGANISM="Strombidium inclinatum, Strain S3" /LENGTH=231 /DNA_ID=CAMNT_0010793515 /DNA_START=2785 /DNA_END=3480 /DNA_ORIENTATION=-